MIVMIALYIRNKKKTKEDINKNNLELDYYDKGILVSNLFSYFLIPFIEKIKINTNKKNQQIIHQFLQMLQNQMIGLLLTNQCYNLLFKRMELLSI